MYSTRRPDFADHKTIDLSNARRVFVFGDLHGRLDLLRAAMTRVNFDAAAADFAICTGDWIDRGTSGNGCGFDARALRDFLVTTPGVLWTRGNHEGILECACFGDEFNGRFDASRGADILIRNGGLWMLDHVDEDGHPNDEIRDFCDLLTSAPAALTIITPRGRRVGIVHAAVPTEGWNEMVAILEGSDPQREDMAFLATWDRGSANYAIAAHHDGQRLEDMIVPGIDHVFYGHTRTGAEPVTHGNQSWIDTGAYKTDILTFVEIDQWIEKQRRS